ncbi:hypothetical protein ENBRE01_2065 [Enteropsectra breve]|nr:hypothetical protein ENBRE01_2065 [Enteropsectra breve]
MGHRKNECQSERRAHDRSQDIINTIQEDHKNKVDRDEIKIKGSKYLALFDTGSSISLTNERVLRELQLNSKRMDSPKRFTLINGNYLFIYQMIKI